MKIKKLLIGLILIALTSCGYQPIYLGGSNTSILINKMQISGNKNINRKIIMLTGLKENNLKKNSYNLSLKSEKNISIIAKNKSGNASVYKTTINVEITLRDTDDLSKIFKTKNFSLSFTYNNIENKFDLQQYQKGIEENLIKNIVKKIETFLKV
tara:strand:- start:2319 stop:2783 length:465 start_codon:yes stop_codon:yes gene_type:complete